MAEHKLRWFLHHTTHKHTCPTKTNTHQFPHNVRYFRQQLRLSKKELARRLDVDYSTISNYERGRRCPNFDTLIKLSDILQVPIDDLLR